MKPKKIKICPYCKEEYILFNSLQPCCLKLDCIKKHRESKEGKKAEKEARKAILKADLYKDLENKIEAKYGENKEALQREINKLARMIDQVYGFHTCIDCGRPFGNQTDGGHFHAVGSNHTIRYNLHGIHSQRSDCNMHGQGGGRKFEYSIGLINRYGDGYAAMVISLPTKYKEIHLNHKEVYEKLKHVRKLIREFDPFNYAGPIDAREKMNNLIGIYK